jgi:dihydrodipicolinate synthase/N-acetylneuraminate lyase
MSLRFDGLIPATVLPMTNDAEIDEAGLRRYVRWMADQGVVGLAINADTGESAHLTHDEKVRVIEIVRDSIPAEVAVVAGLSGPYTAAAVRQARDYRTAGADALLVFPIPAYLADPLDPEIPIRYHEAVADVGLPMIVFQLQPALGGVLFEAETLRRLVTVDGVVAIKEASFDARRYVDTVSIVRSLPRPVAVLTGNDNFIYESFVLGADRGLSADGALIGFGAVMTAEQVDLLRLARARRWDEAAPLARRVQALADLVFAPPVSSYRSRLKEILVLQGLLERATVREPLLPISREERDGLERALSELGLRAVPAA